MFQRYFITKCFSDKKEFILVEIQRIIKSLNLKGKDFRVHWPWLPCFAGKEAGHDFGKGQVTLSPGLPVECLSTTTHGLLQLKTSDHGHWGSDQRFSRSQVTLVGFA